MQQAYAGDGFLGSSDPAVHFGLGDNEVDMVKVIWSTGYIQTVENVDVNSNLHIEEELPPCTIDYSVQILIAMGLLLISLLWPMIQRKP